MVDGAKRWIGGAAAAHYITVVARDAEDGQVKAFLVRGDAPGLTVEKIQRKASLRIVNNGHITLDGVRVPESDRLQRVNSFRDVARMLRAMRADASFLAAGVQAGAYEAAVRYAGAREQFGRPIAGFQLVRTSSRQCWATSRRPWPWRCAWRSAGRTEPCARRTRR